MIGAPAIGAPCVEFGPPVPLPRGARLRELGPADFAHVRALNDTVIAEIADAEMAVLESDEFLLAHLGAVGATIGVECDGTLVACAVLGLPAPDDPYNFGFDIGAGAAVRAAVAHLDGCMVLPRWRGKGVQRALSAWRLARAAAAGRNIVVSAASPRNRYSLRNLLDVGLAIVDLKPKFAGRLRFILLRDLHRAPAPRPEGDGVALDDLDGHRARLAAGERGIAYLDGDDGPRVLYGRTGGGA